MDSGNSESLQSSSGGDEEYDSRASAHPFFINSSTHPPSHLRPISTAAPPPMFDPLSNYTQLQNPHPSSLNPNTSWPMRSDPNPFADANPIIFPPPSAPAAGGNSNDHPGQTAAPRNPRKRSRASRRAPTTVLTTDTTNFRAMVQEFTGIPAPPFTTASLFSRTRLDLFGTRPTATEAPPPFPRRPSAQKIQSPPPFLVSSAATTPINYQLPIAQNSSTIFNVENPNNLTSLLQSNPRFQFSSSKQESFGIPTTEFDDFGLSLHENHASTTLNGLPNLVSPDQIKTTVAGGGGYSLSPAAFRGGKGPENIAAMRGDHQGMVESWICSSE